MSDQNKALQLSITHFPQNLLIPSEEVENKVSFQAVNYINKNQRFRFDLSGENLDVIVPDELNGNIEFGPGETKNFDVKLVPTANGLGKLTLNAYWDKEVQYTVKVQKVRESVPESKIQELLGSRKIESSAQVDEFNPQNFITDMRLEDIRRSEESIQEKKREIENYPQIKAEWDQKNQRYQDYLVKLEHHKKQVEQLEFSIGEGSPPSPPNPPEEVPSPGPEPQLQFTTESIDEEIKTVAKGYLSIKDLESALNTIESISNEVEKKEFRYNLIRAYNSLDLDGTLRAIQKLRKDEKRIELVKKLAIDRVPIDPEQSTRIAMLIEDEAIKDNLVKDIIAKTVMNDPVKAKKISYLLDDVKIRMKVLFAIARKFLEIGQKEEVVEILKEAYQMVLNSDKCNVTESNFENVDYKDFKCCVWSLAEIDCPQTSDTIINQLPNQELKEKVAMDLFNIIYEMVDEIRTKIESTAILSHYYMFNIYSSNINDDLKYFAKIGGNLSNNILTNVGNYSTFFISLFGFDFSVFPIFDRVYNAILANSQKSIGYYIFPSRKNLDNWEKKAIRKTIQQFNIPNSLPNQALVFNIDFIPYLGKPTVILGGNEPPVENIYKKILTLGEAINLSRDSDLFEAGEAHDMIAELFPVPKFTVINILLSYEFINDYDAFQALIQKLNQ